MAESEDTLHSCYYQNRKRRQTYLSCTAAVYTSQTEAV